MTTQNPKTTGPTPSRITLLAVGSRDAILLEMMVQRFLDGSFVVVPSAQADIAIIDGDAAGSQQALADWQRRQPDAPAVVMTLQPLAHADNLTYVTKPIDIPSLTDLLRKLRGQVTSNTPVTPTQAIQSPTAQAYLVASASATRPAAATESPDRVDDEFCASTDPLEILGMTDLRRGLMPVEPTVPHSHSRSAATSRRGLLRNILTKLDTVA